LFSKRLLNALQAVSTKIKRIIVSLVWTTHSTRAWSVVKGDHIISFDTNRRKRLLQCRWVVIIAKYNLQNTWIWFLCDWREGNESGAEKHLFNKSIILYFVDRACRYNSC
jgi:hypothetical protein